MYLCNDGIRSQVSPCHTDVEKVCRTHSQVGNRHLRVKKSGLSGQRIISVLK